MVCWLLCCLFFLMILMPTRFTRADTLFPYTTLFRVCIMRLARVPESSVEFRRVGIVRNGRVQIRAATEPAFGRDQKASVHMNGRHMGIGHEIGRAHV